jgi:hypothetical protein
MTPALTTTSRGMTEGAATMPYRPASVSTLFAITIVASLTAACADPTPTATFPDKPSLERAGAEPGIHRQYGTPIQLGEGRARSYVLLNKGVPVEVGIALDERALDGLRGPMAMPPGEGGEGHNHVDFDSYVVPMPAQNPTPYTFVELDWNPAGHEPANVYTVPHFDFHFYKISVAERDAIVPTDPAFMTKSATVPSPEYLPAFAFSPLPRVAVPRMGVHWIDVRSPEIQPPPNNKPFTTTFLTGTYDGAVIFQEPMITRAYILSKPNIEMQIPVAERVSPAGYYPSAYSITYDAQAKEHRIALTRLDWKN